MKRIIFILFILTTAGLQASSDSIVEKRFAIDKKNWKLYCDSVAECIIYYGINKELVFKQKGKEFDVTFLDTIRNLDIKGETHYWLFLNFDRGEDVENYEFTLKNSPSSSKRPYLCYYDRTTDVVFHFSQKGSYEIYLRQDRIYNQDVEHYWKKIYSSYGNKFKPRRLKISESEAKAAGFQIFLVKFKNKNGSFEAEIPWM